jgi:hypothetical protein
MESFSQYRQAKREDEREYWNQQRKASYLKL